jgi:hypothetical protein
VKVTVMSIGPNLFILLIAIVAAQVNTLTMVSVREEKGAHDVPGLSRQLPKMLARTHANVHALVQEMVAVAAMTIAPILFLLLKTTVAALARRWRASVEAERAHVVQNLSRLILFLLVKTTAAAQVNTLTMVSVREKEGAHDVPGLSRQLPKMPARLLASVHLLVLEVEVKTVAPILLVLLKTTVAALARRWRASVEAERASVVVRGQCRRLMKKARVLMTVGLILFLLVKTTVAAQVNTLTMVREDEGVHAV